MTQVPLMCGATLLRVLDKRLSNLLMSDERFRMELGVDNTGPGKNWSRRSRNLLKDDLAADIRALVSPALPVVENGMMYWNEN